MLVAAEKRLFRRAIKAGITYVAMPAFVHKSFCKRLMPYKLYHVLKIFLILQKNSIKLLDFSFFVKKKAPLNRELSAREDHFPNMILSLPSNFAMRNTSNAV